MLVQPILIKLSGQKKNVMKVRKGLVEMKEWFRRGPDHMTPKVKAPPPPSLTA